MSRLTLLALGATAAAAQLTWYGLAPDDVIRGRVSLFTMDPANGRPLQAAAIVQTNDDEVPKVDTLSCSYASKTCFFMTGVGEAYIQDYLYGVDRVTGATLFKFTLPAGVYVDNLAYDYIHEELWSIAFNPNAPGGGTAGLVSWSSTTGNVTSYTDVTPAIRGGFVFGGAMTMCPTTRQIYVGIDEQNGGLNDRVAQFDVSGATPRLVGEIPLYFPVPSSFFGVCNATALEVLLANTIQSDSASRETMLIGNVIETDDKAGLFVPVARGDLPAYNARGQEALFLNGMFAEFNGQVLIPVYPPVSRAPGGGQRNGFLWSVMPFGPAPTPPGTVTAINYFLAGACGVPGV